MLSLSEVNQMEEAIEIWLRMRVHPLAFKLIQDDELPEGTIVPSRDIGKNLNLCQVFSMVQRYGFTLPVRSTLQTIM